MSAGLQDRVKEMYEAHPYPRCLDPFDANRRAASLRQFEYLGLPPERFENAIVLDAGCGTGEKALHISSLGPKKVVGLDLSTASVKYARENAERFGAKNLTFQNGSVLQMPFEDATFDIVHSAGVLHHTADPYRGFQECARVLKPGGIVMLFLYNSYADWLYHLERAVVESIAGDDTDKRVAVSRKLFGLRERWLARRDGTDLDTRLYDKYGHPQATAHSIGEILGWFEKNGIEFHGIYPPLNLKDMLKLVAQRDDQGAFRAPLPLRPAAAISELVGGFLSSESSGRRGRAPYPSKAMRFLLQSGLFMAGFQDYSYGVCYSGTKPSR